MNASAPSRPDSRHRAGMRPQIGGAKPHSSPSNQRLAPGTAFAIVPPQVTDERTQPLRALPVDPAAALGFDVAKATVDGRDSQWTVEQFLNLTLIERVRLLAGGQVRFFLKDKEVPAREALRGL
jgi:hypothetical protein